MIILTEKIIDEILNHLERSTLERSKKLESSEFRTKHQEIEKILADEFDTDLENMLQSKNSSIHHLESGVKNKIIQKKKEMLDRIKNRSG